jgi:hypothetical protein
MHGGSPKVPTPFSIAGLSATHRETKLTVAIQVPRLPHGDSFKGYAAMLFPEREVTLFDNRQNAPEVCGNKEFASADNLHPQSLRASHNLLSPLLK